MKNILAITRARLRVAVLCVTMGVAEMSWAGHVNESDSEFPPSQGQAAAQLNLGVQCGDQQADVFGHVLVPVFQRPSGVIFVSPGGSWNDHDEQEFNIGLGGRHLFPDKNIILGGNLFYDRRNTELDNTFNQVGFGVEFLSQWLDARVNYYLPQDEPETADDYVVTMAVSQEHSEYWYAPTAQGHTISQYGYELTDTYRTKNLQHYVTTEKAMSGFDGEVGSLLPIPWLMDHVDIKAFVGYVGYTADTGEEIAGMKGRVEVRPVPAVYLDAGWYEDENCYGTKYTVGARATLPFDLARLSHGGNPFAGALAGFKPGRGKSLFAGRLTEMVIRDLHIRTEVTAPVEVIEDRQILEKTLIARDRADYTEILARDVTFVDDDNLGSLGNGTWEHPYRQINTGIQNAVGNIVYVDAASRPYLEAIVLRDGLSLWGSGASIQGEHGSFQGGRYPVVNGGGVSPTITLANHNVVTGFELIQPQGGPAASAVIYGENVTGISLFNNTIRGNGSAETGVKFVAVNTPSFSLTVRNNTILGATGAGIDINVTAVQDVDIDLSRNNVSGNGGAGVNMIGDSVPNTVFVMRDLVVTGNGGDGVRMVLFGGSTVELSSLSAIGNGGAGVSLELYGYSSARAVFNNLVAADNQSAGIQAVLTSGGSVNAGFEDNRVTHNGADGVLLVLNSGLDSFITARRNSVADNGANGINIQTLAPWDSVYDFGLTGSSSRDYGLNSLSGNGSYQFLFNGAGTLSAAGNWWGTPNPVENIDYRAQGGGVMLVEPVLVVNPRP